MLNFNNAMSSWLQKFNTSYHQKSRDTFESSHFLMGWISHLNL